MAFSRRFPRDVPGSPYPSWEELYLDAQEELEIEGKQRDANTELMRECLQDAKKIAAAENLKDYQTDIIHIAISLFEKRASHTVYWKEEVTKEKFDKAFRRN